MIAFSIRNIGSFMSKLLSSDCFDSFLLEEAKIHMAASFSIDGHLNKSFYSSEEWEDRNVRPYDLMPWATARAYCREVIKGRHAPAAFQITLLLKPEYIARTITEEEGASRGLSDLVKTLAINIRLDPSGLHLITAVSMTTFTLDKSADAIWDKTMQRFLSAKGIDFEEEK